MRTHHINRLDASTPLDTEWDGPTWGTIRTVVVDSFHSKSSSHHPDVRTKLAYDQDGIYVFFRVVDRYVRCVHTEYGSATHKDSCVEVFVQPQRHLGYFNFEANCGGALRSRYILDPTRTEQGFKHASMLEQQDLEGIVTFHSLPCIVEPERTDATTWFIQLRIPFALLFTFTQEPFPDDKTEFFGNLYKCADESSHPHWASWAPLGPILDFHQPERFGVFRLS